MIIEAVKIIATALALDFAIMAVGLALCVVISPRDFFTW